MKTEDFNWITEPVIGYALLIKGASIDSNGKKIDGSTYYNVGKHKKNDKVVILKTNQKEQFN